MELSDSRSSSYAQCATTKYPSIHPLSTPTPRFSPGLGLTPQGDPARNAASNLVSVARFFKSGRGYSRISYALSCIPDLTRLLILRVMVFVLRTAVAEIFGSFRVAILAGSCFEYFRASRAELRTRFLKVAYLKYRF
jgi:hypothetical protein